MKHGIPGLARAAAVLALFALGLVWSAPALAVDDANSAVPAATAQERPVVRLPSLKLGEIRRGDAILLTERGMERVKPAVLVQQPVAKASSFPGMCIMQ